MPVTLPDIKRTTRRQSSGSAKAQVPYLQPYLILGDEIEAMTPVVEKAIHLFAEQQGKPRRAFTAQDQENALRPLCGDYRIARCLIAAMMSYYEYRAPAFADILTPTQLAAFEKLELTTAWQLRLAFYEYINRVGAGFVHDGKRAVALRSFAKHLGNPELADLKPETLEELLYLDAEERAVLFRREDSPQPVAAEVIRRFNAMTLSTLTFNASQIVLALARPDGTTVKLIYRLCKFHYLNCEIEQTPGLWEKTGTNDPLRDMPLTLIIAGPDDAFGAPTRWGDRLARLMPRLLRLLMAQKTADYTCYATVQINKRYYRLELNDEIGQAISDAPEIEPEAESYDSHVEENLAREFSALNNQGETAGWSLEREPTPLIIKTRSGPSIFIPDFAFTRAQTHVFLEIIGFWTTAYKEKKRRKLEQLRGRINLILAVSEDAAADFADLGFPLVVYDDYPTVTETVNILNYHFSDWEARREALPAKVRLLVERAQERGLVGEREVMEYLQCYTRNELNLALPYLVPQSIAERRGKYGEADQPPLRYVEGLGLVSETYIARAAEVLNNLQASLPDDVEPPMPVTAPKPRKRGSKAAYQVAPRAATGIPLAQVLERFNAEFGMLEHPEALLAATGATIIRDSLFDAYVLRGE